MPHDEQFIDRFSEHSRLIVPAAEAFRALTSGDGRAQEHATEINRIEEVVRKASRIRAATGYPQLVSPVRHSTTPCCNP